jgi:hypothetical protein
MRASVVEFMAKKAAENFKLKEASFVGFENVEVDEKNVVENNDEDFAADIEVWANISLKYDGTPPESYRVLNRMLQDWVDDHESDLKKMINPKLLEFLKEKYENLNASDLDQDFDDYIWEDQVDYMPEVDEDKKSIQFTVELVLEIEEDDNEDED